jgi:methyl-accepting chemotaxis protein
MSPKFVTNLQEQLNNLSFKTKAISAAVFLSILPVLGVGTLAYIVSYNGLQQTEQDNQQLVTNALSDSLVRYLSLRNKDAQTLAHLPFLTDSKIAATLPAAAKNTFFDEYITRSKIFNGAAVYDLQGNSIAKTKLDSSSNHADRDYFKQVLKTGKPYTSRVETSKTSKISAIYFAAPVRDNITGQVIAVLRLRMPVDILSPIAKAYGQDNNEWHIIDKNTNKLIAAEEAEEVGQDASIFPQFQNLKNSDKVQSTFDTPTTTKKEQLTSTIGLPKTEDLGDSNLAVLMAKDTTIINAKGNGVLLVLVMGMLTAGGLTIALSLLLSSRVTKFIQQMAETISKSSGDIVDTVEMQEVTVNMQANSAIETSTTVNELGAVSFQSAEQAEASARGARQALSLAEDGTRAVQQTLQGMNGLRDKVDAIANQIVNLSEQTGQITTVSELVADLASQTNMLALNAAVEAARAGEQGKGFSVVAGEIRKLADQSKKSADKINALAEDIQTAINRTVMVTDEGTKTVNEGIDLAQSTAATFAGVTDAVNNVFLNSQQISTSAKQQAISIQTVLNSMTTISQGSQESAVGMHQVKMTTRELTQVAEELKAAVV